MIFIPRNLEFPCASCAISEAKVLYRPHSRRNFIQFDTEDRYRLLSRMEKSLKAIMSTPSIHAVFLLVSIAALSNMAAAQTISQQFLDPHNAARQNISGAGIPNLVWNTTLAAYAQSWANTRASTANNCALQHSGGPYGENIYWASWSSTPMNAVTAWVSEKQYYTYSTNSCATGKVCGHYTQVIWKKTTKLGCASATCPSGGTFTVCSYSPPGNYVGQKPY